MKRQYGICNNQQCLNGTSRRALPMNDPARPFCPLCQGPLQPVIESESARRALPMYLLGLAVLLLIVAAAAWFTMEQTPEEHSRSSATDFGDNAAASGDIQSAVLHELAGKSFWGRMHMHDTLNTVLLRFTGIDTVFRRDALRYTMQINMLDGRVQGMALLNAQRELVISEHFDTLAIQRDSTAWKLITARNGAVPFWKLEEIRR